jgi:hypothetical protein
MSAGIVPGTLGMPAKMKVPVNELHWILSGSLAGLMPGLGYPGKGGNACPFCRILNFY